MAFLSESVGPDDYLFTKYLSKNHVSQSCYYARDVDQMLQWIRKVKFESPCGRPPPAFRRVYKQLRSSLYDLIECPCGCLFIRNFFHHHSCFIFMFQFLPDALAKHRHFVSICCEGGNFKSRSLLVVALLAHKNVAGAFSVEKLQTEIVNWKNLEQLTGSFSGTWILLRVLQERHDLHSGVAEWLVSFPSRYLSPRCTDMIVCILNNSYTDEKVKELANVYLNRTVHEWDVMIFHPQQAYGPLLNTLFLVVS